VLFGRPFRNVSKNQLINSINNKKLLVEIEFSIGPRDYVVRRGIKPNIFEIICDGEVINRDAANRDYQKVLEQQILKLNYKTFTQVVILGSATFVPFMQLPAIQRREVIEDILDIKVFSIMNQLLKEKTIDVKDQLVKVEMDISNYKTKIKAQKKLIEILENNHQNALNNIQSKIDDNTQDIKETQARIDIIQAKIEEERPLADTEQLATVSAEGNKMKIKLATNIKTCQNTATFFQNNTTCPTCSQDILDEHKYKVLRDLDDTITGHQSKLDQMNLILDKMEKKLATAKKHAAKLREYTLEISAFSNKISLLSGQNVSLLQEMVEMAENDGHLPEEQHKMAKLVEEMGVLVSRKGKLLESRQLQDVAVMLLKDTGVKTAIIREYLPVMNKLINTYLSAMDFFVKFELDESFQEVIKSRNRDIFTYASFSEGEKQKIDLALMFAWRQIAKMKNSVNTNLLIMDEVFDSSLDSASSEMLLSVLDSAVQDANLFIISHRDAVVGANFNNILRMKKNGNFTTLTASKD
jgi:DNA repair exonuclease SbcCD ATPase subunit